MADFLYLLETRLSPDQLRAVGVVQELARREQMNVYLTGGAMRDMVGGAIIRDLDFTVQGNPLKLQKDLEKAGAVIRGIDEELKTISLLLPGSVHAELQMARSEVYPKPGRPQISAGTITDDLRRRDFTVNAMALSLNEGSRGLLLDPTNGVADVEAKLLRLLHNYSFLEEPSRLIRATRFQARFHWPLEERSQARYNAAKENNYIEEISDRARGYEIEQIGYEDDPLHIMRALEKEGWLRVLHPRWSTAKVDTHGLAALIKTEQQMRELGYSVDAAPARMYFITGRMSEADRKDLQRLIPHREFIAAWRALEDEARDLAKRLSGKEAATPSRTWDLLSAARTDTILFLATTTRNQGVAQKIKNFFTKWRQMKQKLPLPEMIEQRITPEFAGYPPIAEQVFRLQLDGKLRSHNELMKFLKPLAPPPPPPPPPARRARKAEPKPQAAPGKPGAPAGKPGAAPPAAEKGKPAKAAAAPPAKAAAKPATPEKKAPEKKAPEKKTPEKKSKPARKKPTPKPAKKKSQKQKPAKKKR
jgi:tRNA nucleotidyltransferase (CCA-adding enzyme)